MSRSITLSAEVREALAAGRPVVALESSLVTHGLPRPRNHEVALAAEDRVRAEGAVPATVAVRDGCLAVGLARAEIDELAAAGAGKASRSTLGVALSRGGWWGTTVSATMIAARAAGIDVLATGGIGGVHRGTGTSLDISADLEELARTAVAVVCAGPKAIVDVAATIEYLETRGVPVITVGSDEVPGFWSRGSGVPSPIVATDESDAAAIVASHWELGLGSGALVCVPIPEADALPRDESEGAVAEVLGEAAAAGPRGAALTPWLLARLAALTAGRTLAANAALILNDAGAAARFARALASLRPGPSPAP